MAVVARLEGGLGWILDHEVRTEEMKQLVQSEPFIFFTFFAYIIMSTIQQAFVNETYGPHGYGAREELFDVR